VLAFVVRPIGGRLVAIVLSGAAAYGVRSRQTLDPCDRIGCAARNRRLTDALLPRS
jgi:hypothetical protein